MLSSLHYDDLGKKKKQLYARIRDLSKIESDAINKIKMHAWNRNARNKKNHNLFIVFNQIFGTIN